MRAILVVVVMCLVSAVRPVPTVARANHTELDPAKSRSEVVVARRITALPRDTRSASPAIVVAPPAIPPPVRFAVGELHALADRIVIPVIDACSARGPPVG